MEEFLYSMLKREHEIRARPGVDMSYTIQVKQVQGRQLKDATFERRDKNGNVDVIAIAAEAELHVDMEKNEIQVYMRHGHVLDQGKVHGFFETEMYSVPLQPVEKKLPPPRDMTWLEILQDREEVTRHIDEVQTQMALFIAQHSVSLPPTNLEDHRKYFDNTIRLDQQRLYALDAELQMRPSLSFGCLFFVLVGCPVGIWLSKSDYLSAFITCFLPIVLVYYPIQLCTTGLAKDGKVHPALALWSADAVMLVIALLLFRKLMKN
jgi:lipopolysaccharide export system permease protein